MIAETLAETIMSILLLAIPILLVISIALGIRSRRREEVLIRQWCDAKGYAISRMRAFNASLFSALMLLIAGWLMWWVTCKRAWRLTVYDEEGGEKTIVLRVGRSGQVEETWG